MSEHLPWVEAPTVSVDLSLPVAERFRDLPLAAIAGTHRLLDELRSQMPKGLRHVADLVRLRTAGRFHKEAVALARALGVDWRTIMLGNIAYDLVLAMGCSTIALATPSGPLLARNMDEVA